ncbi:MAG: L-threonylcarbamoyladenylate synthase [Pseudomonadota bacterium]
MSDRIDLATVNLDEGAHIGAGVAQKAAKMLRDGGLVAVPTETVYGLAADATQADAVARIFAAKGRPSFNPLIIHVSGTDMARRYGRINEVAMALADAFWPGPLTLVVPISPDAKLAPAVTAGLDTLAIRHAPGAMAQLAGMIDVPLAAPSANSSGRTSPTEAAHVAEDLGDKVDLIVDGGACTVGLESTIVCPSDDGLISILRRGAVTEDHLAPFGTLAVKDKATDETAPTSPGQMLAHYAPSVPLTMNVERPQTNQGWIAFGPDYPANLNGDGAAFQLSATGDLKEAGRHLYGAILALDRAGVASIAVAPIPNSGMGKAINDRLKRAAAGSQSPHSTRKRTVQS